MNRITSYQKQLKSDSLKQRATSGDATAQYELSILCLRNSPAEAFEWLQKAANQGHAGAQASVGASYTEDQYFNLSNPNSSPDVPRDYTKATSWFLKAAMQGDPYAQRRLGDLYRWGQGVPRSREQAAAWYCHAAAQGDTVAQCVLGDIFYFGSGVLQDFNHAALWYYKAADTGSYSGILSLGYLYSDGHGVRQDYAEAYYWFELARVLCEKYRSEFDPISVAVRGYRVDVPISGKHETYDLTSTKERDQAGSHLRQDEIIRAQERVLKWVEQYSARS
jgi:TPR repeat protein